MDPGNSKVCPSPLASTTEAVIGARIRVQKRCHGSRVQEGSTRSTLFLVDPAFVQRIRIESILPKREQEEYIHVLFLFRVMALFCVWGNCVRGREHRENESDMCHLASNLEPSVCFGKLALVRSEAIAPTLTDVRRTVVLIHCHRHRHE